MSTDGSSNPIQWQSLFKQVDDYNLSLQGRISKMLVSAILSGYLRPGSAAPSSRELAKALGVARNTVVFAYQQLVVEGYLVSRERSGHYVSEDLLDPLAASALSPRDTYTRIPADWPKRLSFHPSQQRNIVKPADWQNQPYPFIYAQFDAKHFPTAAWRECCLRALSVLGIRTWAPDLISNDDQALIEAIRNQVLPRRGIWAEEDEIVITVGAQHALYLVANLLIQSHTVVGMEDPGYPDARNIFSHWTDNLVPLPVDGDGLVPSPLLEQCDYIFVTPSHQCPTNATLSMQRRVGLLELVSRSDGILIEDDYETENRYDGLPSPALKSLDRHGRVLYIGSLSKSFAPGLRLGFIVAPRNLMTELRALRRLMIRHPPAYLQRAFALFISLGYYHSLLRHQSQIYRERAQVLQEAVRTYLPQFQGDAIHGGSSWWLEGPVGLDTEQLARAALCAGVVIEPGRVFYHDPQSLDRRHIRLGFSSIDKDRIAPGIQALAQIL